MGYEGIEQSIKTIITFISYILDLQMNKPKVNITDIRICFEFVLGRLKTNIMRIYSTTQGRLHTTSGKYWPHYKPLEEKKVE